MKIATTIAEVRAQVREWKQQGLTVGLVPTMGYLHEGHASLVKTSVQQCDRTVASVFLNPTQFGPGEDLETYPRDFEHDCALLTECGCDMVFHPEVSEMYPDGFATFVEVQSEMPRQLCGKTRPIHFRGVCTVVSKLFNIVTPDKAFFGQKDAQQVEVLKRMVKDLFFNIQLRIMPIVREADGLAKSSRNTYLSEAEHKAALVLSRSLKAAKEQYEAGERDAAKITAAVTASIKEEPMADIDYVEIYALPELKPVAAPMAGSNLLAVAVKFGTTRLIDNVVLEEK